MFEQYFQSLKYSIELFIKIIIIDVVFELLFPPPFGIINPKRSFNRLWRQNIRSSKLKVFIFMHDWIWLIHCFLHVSFPNLKILFHHGHHHVVYRWGFILSFRKAQLHSKWIPPIIILNIISHSDNHLGMAVFEIYFKSIDQSFKYFFGIEDFISTLCIEEFVFKSLNESIRVKRGYLDYEKIPIEMRPQLVKRFFSV